MRFAFIDAWRHQWRVTALAVMGVSERGCRSWRGRPTSTLARTDMKVLAHIREQYSLSLGSYGRPRMTMELKEAGLVVGERRVGRRSSSTSTGSTTPEDAIHFWAASARPRSKPRWRNEIGDRHKTVPSPKTSYMELKNGFNLVFNLPARVRRLGKAGVKALRRKEPPGSKKLRIHLKNGSECQP